LAGPTLIHLPLQFIVSCFGFVSKTKADDAFGTFWEPRIETSSIHFVGRHDSIVSAELSQGLIDACKPSCSASSRHRVVKTFAGGH
jgi:hypothetical protein